MSAQEGAGGGESFSLARGGTPNEGGVGSDWNQLQRRAVYDLPLYHLQLASCAVADWGAGWWQDEGGLRPRYRGQQGNETRSAEVPSIKRVRVDPLGPRALQLSFPPVALFASVAKLKRRAPAGQAAPD